MFVRNIISYFNSSYFNSAQSALDHSNLHGWHSSGYRRNFQSRTIQLQSFLS